MPDPIELWLVRHGETQWSASGAHTSFSDIPLTPAGERSAAAVGAFLAGRPFSLVLASPRQRAMETCRIAGYGAVASIDHNLSEWNYGQYEGKTTPEIRAQRPGWSIWAEGPAGGESVEEVGQRAAKIIERAAAAGGAVVLFSHAHLLRILAATWLGLPPANGSRFALSTGSVSVLAHERETRVVRSWNRCFEGTS